MKFISIRRDLKRRRSFSRFELNRIVLKSIATNEHLNFELRQKAWLDLSKLARNSSVCRIRNRCVVSGRSRGTLRMFRLSRIKFRELALLGQLPGIIKASW